MILQKQGLGSHSQTMHSGRQEVEAARAVLANVGVLRDAADEVAGMISRIVSGYKEAQFRRLRDLLTDYEPKEWREKSQNFEPVDLFAWLSGMTIVGSHRLLSMYSRIDRPVPEQYDLLSFAGDLVKGLPLVDSTPKVVLRRSDRYNLLEIAFATVEDLPANTTP